MAALVFGPMMWALLFHLVALWVFQQPPVVCKPCRSQKILGEWMELDDLKGKLYIFNLLLAALAALELVSVFLFSVTSGVDFSG